MIHCWGQWHLIVKPYAYITEVLLANFHLSCSDVASKISFSLALPSPTLTPCRHPGAPPWGLLPRLSLAPGRWQCHSMSYEHEHHTPRLGSASVIAVILLLCPHDVALPLSSSKPTWVSFTLAFPLLHHPNTYSTPTLFLASTSSLERATPQYGK